MQFLKQRWTRRRTQHSLRGQFDTLLQRGDGIVSSASFVDHFLCEQLRCHLDECNGGAMLDDTVELLRLMTRLLSAQLESADDSTLSEVVLASKPFMSQREDGALMLFIAELVQTEALAEAVQGLVPLLLRVLMAQALQQDVVRRHGLQRAEPCRRARHVLLRLLRALLPFKCCVDAVTRTGDLQRALRIPVNDWQRETQAVSQQVLQALLDSGAHARSALLRRCMRRQQMLGAITRVLSQTRHLPPSFLCDTLHRLLQLLKETAIRDDNEGTLAQQCCVHFQLPVHIGALLSSLLSLGGHSSSERHRQSQQREQQEEYEQLAVAVFSQALQFACVPIDDDEDNREACEDDAPLLRNRDLLLQLQRVLLSSAAAQRDTFLHAAVNELLVFVSQHQGNVAALREMTTVLCAQFFTLQDEVRQSLLQLLRFGAEEARPLQELRALSKALTRAVTACGTHVTPKVQCVWRQALQLVSHLSHAQSLLVESGVLEALMLLPPPSPDPNDADRDAENDGESTVWNALLALVGDACSRSAMLSEEVAGDSAVQVLQRSPLYTRALARIAHDNAAKSLLCGLTNASHIRSVLTALTQCSTETEQPPSGVQQLRALLGVLQRALQQSQRAKDAFADAAGVSLLAALFAQQNDLPIRLRVLDVLDISTNEHPRNGVALEDALTKKTLVRAVTTSVRTERETLVQALMSLALLRDEEGNTVHNGVPLVALLTLCSTTENDSESTLCARHVLTAKTRTVLLTRLLSLCEGERVHNALQLCRHGAVAELLRQIDWALLHRPDTATDTTVTALDGIDDDALADSDQHRDHLRWLLLRRLVSVQVSPQESAVLHECCPLPRLRELVSACSVAHLVPHAELRLPDASLQMHNVQSVAGKVSLRLWCHVTGDVPLLRVGTPTRASLVQLCVSDGALHGHCGHVRAHTPLPLRRWHHVELSLGGRCRLVIDGATVFDEQLDTHEHPQGTLRVVIGQVRPVSDETPQFYSKEYDGVLRVGTVTVGVTGHEVSDRVLSPLGEPAHAIRDGQVHYLTEGSTECHDAGVSEGVDWRAEYPTRPLFPCRHRAAPVVEFDMRLAMRFDEFDRHVHALPVESRSARLEAWVLACAAKTPGFLVPASALGAFFDCAGAATCQLLSAQGHVTVHTRPMPLVEALRSVDVPRVTLPQIRDALLGGNYDRARALTMLLLLVIRRSPSARQQALVLETFVLLRRLQQEFPFPERWLPLRDIVDFTCDISSDALCLVDDASCLFRQEGRSTAGDILTEIDGQYTDTENMQVDTDAEVVGWNACTRVVLRESWPHRMSSFAATRDLLLHLPTMDADDDTVGDSDETSLVLQTLRQLTLLRQDRQRLLRLRCTTLLLDFARHTGSSECARQVAPLLRALLREVRDPAAVRVCVAFLLRGTGTYTSLQMLEERHAPETSDHQLVQQLQKQVCANPTVFGCEGAYGFLIAPSDPDSDRAASGEAYAELAVVLLNELGLVAQPVLSGLVPLLSPHFFVWLCRADLRMRVVEAAVTLLYRLSSGCAPFLQRLLSADGTGVYEDKELSWQELPFGNTPVHHSGVVEALEFVLSSGGTHSRAIIKTVASMALVSPSLCGALLWLVHEQACASTPCIEDSTVADAVEVLLAGMPQNAQVVLQCLVHRADAALLVSTAVRSLLSTRPQSPLLRTLLMLLVRAVRACENDDVQRSLLHLCLPTGESSDVDYVECVMSALLENDALYGDQRAFVTPSAHQRQGSARSVREQSQQVTRHCVEALLGLIDVTLPDLSADEAETMDSRLPTAVAAVRVVFGVDVGVGVVCIAADGNSNTAEADSGTSTPKRQRRSLHALLCRRLSSGQWQQLLVAALATLRRCLVLTRQGHAPREGRRLVWELPLQALRAMVHFVASSQLLFDRGADFSEVRYTLPAILVLTEECLALVAQLSRDDQGVVQRLRKLRLVFWRAVLLAQAHIVPMLLHRDTALVATLYSLFDFRDDFDARQECGQALAAVASPVVSASASRRSSLESARRTLLFDSMEPVDIGVALHTHARANNDDSGEQSDRPSGSETVPHSGELPDSPQEHVDWQQLDTVTRSVTQLLYRRDDDTGLDPTVGEDDMVLVAHVPAYMQCSDEWHLHRAHRLQQSRDIALQLDDISMQAQIALADADMTGKKCAVRVLRQDRRRETRRSVVREHEEYLVRTLWRQLRRSTALEKLLPTNASSRRWTLDATETADRRRLRLVYDFRFSRRFQLQGQAPPLAPHEPTTPLSARTRSARHASGGSGTRHQQHRRQDSLPATPDDAATHARLSRALLLTSPAAFRREQRQQAQLDAVSTRLRFDEDQESTSLESMAEADDEEQQEQEEQQQEQEEEEEEASSLHQVGIVDTNSSVSPSSGLSEEPPPQHEDVVEAERREIAAQLRRILDPKDAPLLADTEECVVNIARVRGLDARRGIIVLCRTSLYLVDGLSFDRETGHITRAVEPSFDFGEVEDVPSPAQAHEVDELDVIVARPPVHFSARLDRNERLVVTRTAQSQQQSYEQQQQSHEQLQQQQRTHSQPGHATAHYSSGSGSGTSRNHSAHNSCSGLASQRGAVAGTSGGVSARQVAGDAPLAVSPLWHIDAVEGTELADHPDEGEREGDRVDRWHYSDIAGVLKRRYQLQSLALEVFLRDGSTTLLVLASPRRRNEFYRKLMSLPLADAAFDVLLRDGRVALGAARQRSRRVTVVPAAATDTDSDESEQPAAVKYAARLLSARRCAHAPHHGGGTAQARTLATALGGAQLLSWNRQRRRHRSQHESYGADKLAQRSAAAAVPWRSGHMSNFAYLQLVNTLAGRTPNDLTQWPVVPWVVADYDTPDLRLGVLEREEATRDLSRPIGALDEERRKRFQRRYADMESQMAGLLDADNALRPFHYGTHMSSAAGVLHFLLRLSPFTRAHVELQSGRFDHSDRLFDSVRHAWRLCSTVAGAFSDVKELTPEFYYQPAFLCNTLGLNLGRTQKGRRVHDVRLPRWALHSPHLFVQLHREALESDIVSKTLSRWLDLVFGCKQRSVADVNCYAHLSYEGAVDLRQVHDPVQRRSFVSHINNFGQTPRQLLPKGHPHPQRDLKTMTRLRLWLSLLFQHAQDVFRPTSAQHLHGRVCDVLLHDDGSAVPLVCGTPGTGAIYLGQHNVLHYTQRQFRVLSLPSTSVSHVRADALLPVTCNSDDQYRRLSEDMCGDSPTTSAAYDDDTAVIDDHRQYQYQYHRSQSQTVRPRARSRLQRIMKRTAPQEFSRQLCVSPLQVHDGGITCVCTLGDDLVFTGGHDARVAVWRLVSIASGERTAPSTSSSALSGAAVRQGPMRLQLLRVFCAHRRSVTALCASDDLRVLVSADADGVVLSWDINTLCLLRRFDALPNLSEEDEDEEKNTDGSSCSSRAVQEVLLDENWGRVFVVTTRRVTLFSINGEVLGDTSLPAKTPAITALDAVYDRVHYKPSVLVTGHSDGSVRLWHSLPNTRLLRAARSHDETGSAPASKDDFVWRHTQQHSQRGGRRADVLLPKPRALLPFELYCYASWNLRQRGNNADDSESSTDRSSDSTGSTDSKEDRAITVVRVASFDSVCVGTRGGSFAWFRVVREVAQWERDEAAPECPFCAKKFTMVERRHHCRKCGQVCCSACSRRKAPAPSLGFPEPVRVCDICYESTKVALEARKHWLPGMIN